MTAPVRAMILAALVTATVVAQSAVFGFVSVDGVVPDLVLVLVVAAGVARGSQFAATVGLAAGLLLDLAPPADHVAGRWALALVLVGHLAGRVRQDVRGSPLATVLLVGAASFVGNSVYALSGLVLRDGAVPADQMLEVIGVGVLWDLMLAPFLVPVLLRVLDLARPPRMS